MSDWRIPLSDLTYDSREEEAALRVIRSRWLSMGPEVAALEEEFAAFVGVEYAFAVSSGTAALHLALLAGGVRPGDEVIQPAVNFIAAANMTVAVGATPVFADVIALTEPTLDPAAAAAAVTDRTRALVVMHYGGHLCRMAELAALCRDRGLLLIEDACHAIGARFVEPHGRGPHGCMAGAIGDVACFSFFSNKNLATGEGGMVVTDRADVAERIRALRSHGMTTLTWDRHKGHATGYDVVAHGYNYRFDETRAAVARVQLDKLPGGNARRFARVASYRELLTRVDGPAVSFADRGEESAHHLMVVVAADPAQRTLLADALRRARVQTSLHYPCAADFTVFAGSAEAMVPISRDFATRTLTLPLYPDLSLDDVRFVCEEMIDALDGSSGDAKDTRMR
ncbi:MAG: DegT/DnrJ/EryC1/StrS family aminotransferase [Thermoleophilia bacterium]